MEGYISSTVKSLHLIAHVLKQQFVFVQVHLQPASEQTKQELHPRCWDHTLGKTYRAGYSVIQETVTWLTWPGIDSSYICVYESIIPNKKTTYIFCTAWITLQSFQVESSCVSCYCYYWRKSYSLWYFKTSMRLLGFDHLGQTHSVHKPTHYSVNTPDLIFNSDLTDCTIVHHISSISYNIWSDTSLV